MNVLYKFNSILYKAGSSIVILFGVCLSVRHPLYLQQNSLYLQILNSHSMLHHNIKVIECMHVSWISMLDLPYQLMYAIYMCSLKILYSKTLEITGSQ